PYKVTLVPEKREEVTTEGGLDVKNNFNKIKNYCIALKNEGIKVSLFVEADFEQLENYIATGADEIEIHTGLYSLSSEDKKAEILEEIRTFSRKAVESNLVVCAGHGLNYHNVQSISKIREIVEFNIGYSIITKSIFFGLGEAVKEMKNLIVRSR
ncbi:MAG TPA: pyridoxine 5'-phosphate synthase, partial [Spirochaetota bacterium]|nr:pyridoxine 5'-phosphate synthase [Spirochaetota bacterium]